MSRPYFPGSTTEIRLKAIARKLDGKVASDFAGITVHGNRILYRHAQYGTLFAKGKKYERLDWGNPFGKDRQLDGIDYVLLHATRPEEKFFLFTARKARIMATIFPTRLNVAVDPLKDLKGGREKVWEHLVSLVELKRVLNR